MNPDLTPFLRAWDYRPGEMNVRLIDGLDGRPKMQIRIELGLLQLELEGRPDGRRPFDAPSLLEHQQARLKSYQDEFGDSAGFILAPDECRALREEAAQFHHRAAGFLSLEQYEPAIMDVERNLHVVELCREFAAAPEDRDMLNPLLPHLLATRARAIATLAVTRKDVKTAMAMLDQGIQQLLQAYAMIGRRDEGETSNEVQLLRGMKDALVPKLPMSQRVELEQRLQAALAAENYELAAILRDELRLMPD